MAIKSSLSLLAAGAVLLIGCYKPADMGYHQAGVYVGKPDPLVSRAATPEHARQLQQRFALVQTDR